MADDDKRAAATIETSLSSYVTTAALGIIAAQAAFVTFILDKRENTLAFDAIALLGFIALVVSILCGGKGVAEVYQKGYEGTWIIKTSKRWFEKQAALTLLGSFLVLLSVFVGVFSGPRGRSPKLASAKSGGDRVTSTFHLERLAFAGIFNTGDNCALEGGTTVAKEVKEAADEILRRGGGGPVFVIVIGSADRQELGPSTRLRFGSNTGLAQERAECVAGALRDKVGNRSQAALQLEFITLARGSTHPDPRDWSKDREAEVLLAWTGP